MEEIVVTSEKASTSFTTSTETRMICHVCQKQFSQYTCPRCNSRYCSLDCYKSHCSRCTESFMRENVVEELGQMQPDDETKLKMIDILKRFHSEEEMEPMDEDDGPSLSEETIQKILSGNLLSLDDLSAEEIKQFQRAIASGELSKLIEPWEPWWLKPSARNVSLSREGAQLVQSVQQQGTPQESIECSRSTEIPAGPETSLQPINKLVSTRPSPLVSVHLVDVIYSYCFTIRLYNGDWQSDALDAAMVVLSLSNVLSEGGQPETVSEALAHCLELACSPAYRHAGGLRFGLGLFDDIMRLLNLGGPVMICLLCDLQRLIHAARAELQSEKPTNLKKREIKNKLKFADRKVYFLMCWVHEQPGEVWSSLASMVDVQKKTIAETGLGERRKPVQFDSKESKGKVLIEELL
ncbi:Zinc finger hit domain-containing [Thalictrum thalictroides]|uniref:Zinc finger hit domain-containing n=1 Tax=Thalictrum thalictroides TaxID=46969 RepID=A0A7J6V406_THATH|nr:Zinc finger hit domain-containing [Thalictrum thalictroides]